MSAMEVAFWGVRGSIPTPAMPKDIKEKLLSFGRKVVKNRITGEDELTALLESLPIYERSLIGGNTSCVHVKIGDKHLIFDSGTGIQKLGLHLISSYKPQELSTISIIQSHTHWDHIQGFPFFAPLFIKGLDINIYGVHPHLKERFERQQIPQHFPVSIEMMQANLDFIQLQPDTKTEIQSGIFLSNQLHKHPGGSYGYRLEHEGKSLVYATDSDFQHYNAAAENGNGKALKLFSGADIVIFDSQFTLRDNAEKFDWGHCSAMNGIDISIRENVKHLVLFHHDPNYSDQKIHDNYLDAKDYLEKVYPRNKDDLDIILAYEGLKLEIN